MGNEPRRRLGAWVRYGEPLTAEQLDVAAEHYGLAILQPWELEALAFLKERRPDMVVLCYKCLSSTRSYEPGPVYTSGISFSEAESAGGEWFATRDDGSRIEWDRYPGHWQMTVWREDYARRWSENVRRELEASPWDGVLADNDVFDDYYGLRRGMRTDPLPRIRAGLDAMVQLVGRDLNAAGKLLVPNIAESRRRRGRWRRHAAFGGGFEEVWLAWGADEHLDEAAAIAQGRQMTGPGLVVTRTDNGGSLDHPNTLLGLAAALVFGGNRDGMYYAATGHDDYSGTPVFPELGWQLGMPASRVRRRDGVVHRTFTGGWAGANLGVETMSLPLPFACTDRTGAPLESVTLEPRHGAVLRRVGTARGGSSSS